MDKIDKLLIGIMITCIFFLGGFLSMWIGEDKINNFFNKDYTPDQIPMSEQQIINNCKNLNLVESSYCLRDNVKTFFNYTITNKQHYDIETLKEVGGDCLNWGLLTVKLGKKLSFNSELVYIEDNSVRKHVVTLISNKNFYCIVDYPEINCMRYRNEN